MNILDNVGLLEMVNISTTELSLDSDKLGVEFA